MLANCVCPLVKKTTTTTSPKPPAQKKEPPKQQSVGFNPDDILKVKLGKKKQPVGPPPPPPPPPPEETASSDPDWAPKNYIEKGLGLIKYCSHEMYSTCGCLVHVLSCESFSCTEVVLCLLIFGQTSL